MGPVMVKKRARQDIRLLKSTPGAPATMPSKSLGNFSALLMPWRPLLGQGLAGNYAGVESRSRVSRCFELRRNYAYDRQAKSTTISGLSRNATPVVPL
jgi:hypothetical protein